MELLSPAGNWNSLKAAVLNGADAVYLGLKEFSARSFAQNFSLEDLDQIIPFCHSCKCKVYLAANTLVKNYELPPYFQNLQKAYEAGIDAVIIQEISFISLIKKSFPGLEVHISTQANIHNSPSAELLKEADRLILARELSLEEIKRIKAAFGKPVEIFVHGALCVSMSGHCLFSSMLGGRSGNRGKCAQPCRKRHNTCFYLSLKDLCLAEKIPELAKAGIDSIKIEGRLRSPFYTAVVTKVYRSAIDKYQKERKALSVEEMEELSQSFNRGFTQGFAFEDKEIFNRERSSGKEIGISSEEDRPLEKTFRREMKRLSQFVPPVLPSKPNQDKSQLWVKVYSLSAIEEADKAGASVIYIDLFHPELEKIKVMSNRIKEKLFFATPRIITDEDFPKILKVIDEYRPAGLLVGNLGLLKHKWDIPLHLDYNLNLFNDLDMEFFRKLNKKIVPIISPELKISELARFQDKNFAVLSHGKIILMTLRHKFDEKELVDDRNEHFKLNKIFNGSEVANSRPLGLFNLSQKLFREGIKYFYLDLDERVVGNRVEKIVSTYKKIIAGEKLNDKKLRAGHTVGWLFRGVE